MDHNVPVVKMLAQFSVSGTEMVDPNRRICENQFAAPCGVEHSSIAALWLPETPSVSAFSLDEGFESFTNHAFSPLPQ